MRAAVSWMGHWVGAPRTRRSTRGSATRRSTRAKGTNAASPATRTTHGHGLDGPCSRSTMSPAMTRAIATVTSQKPCQSTRPVVATGTWGTP